MKKLLKPFQIITVTFWVLLIALWAAPVQSQQTVIKYLRQLLDVRISSSPANNDLLSYQTNVAKWTNIASSAFSGFVSGVVAGTNIVTTTNVSAITVNLANSIDVPGYIAQGEIQLSYATATNLTLNAALGNMFRVSLTNTAFFTQPLNVKTGMTFVVICAMDATGGYGVTFQTNAWRFPGGTVPTITTNANAIDILSCVAINTTNFAVVSVQNVQ